MDPAPLSHCGHVCPEVAEVGHDGAAAVAGHFRSHRQRPGARPQNSHLYIGHIWGRIYRAYMGADDTAGPP